MSTAYMGFSEQEKKELVARVVNQTGGAAKGHLPVLQAALTIIDRGDSAATLADVAGLFGNSRLMTATAGTISLLNILAFPVSALLSVADAADVGYRMYAMRAVAYTITAWAFGDPIPAGSPTNLSYLKNGMPRATKEALERYRKTWQQASASALRSLHQAPVQLNVTSSSLKVFYRAVGDDSRQKLCRCVLEEFTVQLPPPARLTWRSNYAIQYPL